MAKISLHRWKTLAALIVAGLAIGSVQAEVIGQSGDWIITSDYNAVSKVTRFSVGEHDTTKAALLVLTCTNARDAGFTVDNEAFKPFPYGTRVSISGRLPKEEPYDFYGMASGTDRFIILMMTEPVSFGWLLAQMNKGTAIGLTTGSRQWIFNLEGFRSAAEKILGMCDKIPAKP